MCIRDRFPRLRCGPLEFDTGRKAFLLSGEPLALTPREHAALSALLHKTGQPISKVHLFDKVFNLDSDSSPDAVEVVVHRLRKKLAVHGRADRHSTGAGLPARSRRW